MKKPKSTYFNYQRSLAEKICIPFFEVQNNLDYIECEIFSRNNNVSIVFSFQTNNKDDIINMLAYTYTDSLDNGRITAILRRACRSFVDDLIIASTKELTSKETRLSEEDEKKILDSRFQLTYNIRERLLGELA